MTSGKFAGVGLWRIDERKERWWKIRSQFMSNDGGLSHLPAGSEVYNDHVACVLRYLTLWGGLGGNERPAFIERDCMPSGIATGGIWAQLMAIKTG